MKSALRTSRFVLAGLTLALLAGCYGTGYVGVRHDRYYPHYPYQSSSYYAGYPYYGNRYYRSAGHYRPYSYRYYSGRPSLNRSYTHTTHRAPGYGYRAPSYGYSSAPRYSATTYVDSSPRYSAVRLSSARAVPASGPGKAHAKRQIHGKRKGQNQ